MDDQKCEVCGNYEEDHAMTGLYDDGEAGPTVAGSYTDDNTFTVCVQGTLDELRDEAKRLTLAIRSALYDYDHRDEVSAVQTLRDAIRDQP